MYFNLFFLKESSGLRPAWQGMRKRSISHPDTRAETRAVDLYGGPSCGNWRLHGTLGHRCNY